MYNTNTHTGHLQKEDCILGEIKFIKEPYLHYRFSIGWDNWFEKNNIYSNKKNYLRFNYKLNLT